MKWLSEIITWSLLAVVIIWGAGGKERFDCAVFHVQGACASIEAAYAPSTPTVGEKTP